MSDKPVKIRDGVLSVSVFKNTTQDGKTFYNVKPAKGYKKDDEWHETDNLNSDDLLPMARLLEKAYDKIAELKAEDKAE